MVTWYSASDPLLSARFKLERAELHIDDLDVRLRDFLDQRPKPYTMVRELDTKFPPSTFRYIIQARPPRTWAGPAGDAVTNLRASLDHVICALSVHWLSRTEPSDATAFVLTDLPKAFNGLAHQALSHLPDEIWREVEALQPYHRANRPELGLLLALTELVNADKHRSIQPILTRVTATVGGVQQNLGRLDDGDRVVVGIRDPQSDFEEVSFTVGIGFLLRAHDQLVGIDGLRQIHDLLRDEVLPRFEPFFDIEPPKVPITRPKPTRRRRRRRSASHKAPPSDGASAPMGQLPNE